MRLAPRYQAVLDLFLVATALCIRYSRRENTRTLVCPLCENRPEHVCEGQSLSLLNYSTAMWKSSVEQIISSELGPATVIHKSQGGLYAL
jgi:hypothetical protein